MPQFVLTSAAQVFWMSAITFAGIGATQRLTTASNFNLRQRFSPAPSEEDVIANKATWDRNMKKAMVLAHQNAEVLEKEYDTSLDQIKAGDTFHVKTDYQTKDGKKYIRLISFLPKGAELNGGGVKSDVPF